MNRHEDTHHEAVHTGLPGNDRPGRPCRACSAPRDEGTGLKATFARTSWHNRSLRGASQAGLVNNLNDGLAAVGLIKGLYPILWGIGQIPTGHLADRIGRKPLIVTGMLVQAAGFILALALLDRPLLAGGLSAVALGLGTAMVYPALIASVSDHAHPAWRANALGTYRFWRDIGYAVGCSGGGHPRRRLRPQRHRHRRRRPHRSLRSARRPLDHRPQGGLTVGRHDARRRREPLLNRAMAVPRPRDQPAYALRLTADARPTRAGAPWASCRAAARS
ncbi:MFS transporter [Streptomyces sp. NBC_01643]|uniref:MFS transporter n=1 Tax=Streptomyces sp. NBC_01643 TaxID=2975906 RepID=UPI00386A25E0|nr:MFS transporter [Streptomyces sp. NBC_01643]